MEPALRPHSDAEEEKQGASPPARPGFGHQLGVAPDARRELGKWRC